MHAQVAMEVIIAVQSDTLLRALRVLVKFLCLKRRVSARRGGDYLQRSLVGDPEEEFRGGWKYYASWSLRTTITILTQAQRTRVHFCQQENSLEIIVHWRTITLQSSYQEPNLPSLLVGGREVGLACISRSKFETYQSEI